MSDSQQKTAGKLDTLKAMIGPMIGGGIELGATIRSANQSGTPVDPVTALTAAAAGGYSGYRWQHLTNGANKGETAANIGKNLGVTIGDLMLPRAVDTLQTGRESMSLSNQLKRKELNSGTKPTPAATVAPASSGPMMDKTTAGILGGSIVGAGALYALSSYLKSKQKQEPTIIQQAAAPMSADGSPLPPPAPGNSSGGGTLRVTLPTRRPTDQETQVEIPLDRIGLSNALMNKIKRDTKRRLRTESDARTHRIIPSGMETEVLKVATAYQGYGGLATQAYTPIQAKRQLSPQEQGQVEEAESRILPTFFPSDADSMAAKINSPLLRSIMYGLAGAGAGGYLGTAAGGGSLGATLAGAGIGGLIGGGLGYFTKKQDNANVVDAMSRLPEGATTLRDMESDPVYQSRMERQTSRDNAMAMAAALARR